MTHPATSQFTDTDRHDLIAVAHRLADAARSETLTHFRSPDLTDENKRPEDYDPVTEADRGAERAMRGILAEMRPQDGILGEEYGTEAGHSGLTWVLDPVDGTRGFVAGTPTWGVLIALCDATGPLYGIVDQPYIGERFEGGFGLARMSGPLGQKALSARKGRALNEAVLFTTFPEVGTRAEQRAFQALADQVRLTRYGMDCYAYALLAAGHADLVIEAGLAAYDICAPIAVIEAAGGIVTNWDGGPVHEGGRAVAAASAELHDQALQILASAS